MVSTTTATGRPTSSPIRTETGSAPAMATATTARSRSSWGVEDCEDGLDNDCDERADEVDDMQLGCSHASDPTQRLQLQQAGERFWKQGN